MADQNRYGEGRFRRDSDDDDRRWQRRDEEDDQRREERGERSFGRDEGYGRGSRSYGSSAQSQREQGGYGGRFGASERGGYSNDYARNRGYPSGGRQDYDQDYGSQRHAGVGHSGQGYPGYDEQGYGGQRHAGVGHSGLGGRDYGNQRYGGEESYASQRYGSQGQSYGGGQGYGSQDREGPYGRSYGTPQYGAFRSSESGRQGREWQEFGSGASQNVGSWQRGEHRGKGPKGYTRSDERIREDVCDSLSDDDELDASDITVTVKGGEVTLEGSVPDRRAKQRAEDLAEAVSGVRDVDNKLRKSKGMLQEMGDKLTGSQNNERGGYAGSGTKNTPPNASMSR